jgi:hypothetical protein
VTTGCAGEGVQGTKDKSLIMVDIRDVGYGSRRRTTILSCSLRNAIHDSTPSLGAELLRGLDAVICDMDVEDDNEDVHNSDRMRARR